MPAAAVTARLLARNATRNLLALGVPLVVALIAMPLLVARLDTMRFGVLGLAWVFFGLFAELGLGRATTKYTAEAFAGHAAVTPRTVVRFGVLLQLVLGLVLGAALAAGAAPLAVRLVGAVGDVVATGSTTLSAVAIVRETRGVLYVVAAALPFVMMATAYRGVLEAAHRFDLVNRVRIPLSVATYLLPALLVLAGAGLVTITAALALSRLAGAVWYARLAGGVLRRHGASATASARATVAPPAAGLSRVMLSFGAWQTLSGLLSPLLVYLDRFLLGAIAGVAAVGLYTPAFEVATRMLILPASVVMALFPAFSAWSGGAAVENAQRTARTAARAVLFIVAALLPLVVLVVGLGGDALGVWLNDEFAGETAVALGLLACGALLNAAAFVPATLLQGMGRPDLPTKLYLVELPLYLVLATALITWWGVAGAAAAWTLRVSVDAGLLFTITHRLGVLPLRELIRARVPQSLAGAALIALAPAWLAAAQTSPGLRLAWTGAALAAAVAFVWSYSLRADGRARIAEALGLVSA